MCGQVFYNEQVTQYVMYQIVQNFGGVNFWQMKHLDGNILSAEEIM